MVTEKILIKFGFAKDENNSQLKEMFKNGLKLKEIHIDVYPENPLIASSTPFTLLSRTIEKNVKVLNDDDRLILIRNDKFETHLMNVLFSKITESLCKTSDGCSEFILNIQNIYFRLIVLN